MSPEMAVCIPQNASRIIAMDRGPIGLCQFPHPEQCGDSRINEMVEDTARQEVEDWDNPIRDPLCVLLGVLISTRPFLPTLLAANNANDLP